MSQQINLLTFPLLLAISFSLNNPCAPEKNQPVEKIKKVEEPVRDVSVIYPRFTESTRVVQGRGRFSVSDRLNLKAEFSGMIEKVHVGEGDQVKGGDPLCLIKSDDLNKEIERKQAELKEAEAQLEADRKIFQASGGIETEPGPLDEETEPAFIDEETGEPAPYRENSPTPPTVKGPETDLESRFKISEARVERINTELDQLEERLKKLIVTSPLAGVIHKRNVTEGSIFEEGDELFEIIVNNPMTLTVHLPQTVASYVDKQSPVRASPLSASDKSVDGTIFYISPEIDTVNRTLEIRLHLPNEEGLIKEGQEGQAVVSTRKVEKLLIIPRRAVVDKEGGKFIFVVMNGKAVLTEISLGQAMENFDVEITANIRVDDPIVVEGQESLSNGNPVKILDDNTAEAPLAPAIHTSTSP